MELGNFNPLSRIGLSGRAPDLTEEVVRDNVSVRKGGRVRELIEGAASSSCSCRLTRCSSAPLKRPFPR
jgi:hypothetical protein